VQSVTDRRIDVGGDLVSANVAFLPAYTRAHQQPIAIGHVLEQLGMRHAETGARAEAGIEHEGIDVAFGQRARRELGKSGKLPPQAVLDGIGPFHAA